VTAYEAIHLTQVAPIPDDAESLTFESFSPPFPEGGIPLDQVRWKAGLLELLLNCLVEVVVTGDEQVGIRFIRTESHGALSGSGSPYRFDYPAVEAYLQGLLDMAILVRGGAFDRD
jgi:hypothetical protein